MSNSSSLEASVDAILHGAQAFPAELLQYALPGGAGDGAFAALLWSKWQRQSGLHETFLAALEPIARNLGKLPIAALAQEQQHPLWSLLDLLHVSGIGYQPELARAAEKIIGDLQPVLALVEAGDWQGAGAKAASQWQTEHHRLQRLEQRLSDSERGALRASRAQQQAARVLNRALAGKRLSTALMHYLQHDWYRELQWCLLQFGEDSAAWQRRVELTTRLLDSLQDPQDDNERRQHLYALIPEVDAELRAVLSEHAPAAHTLEQQLALIESHHVALLKGRPLPAAPCVLIANNDVWAGAATTITRDLLQQVTALELGSWFLLRDESELRIKLALKMDDTAQLLFVNRVGVKALQKSFEEFAYLLALGTVTPLPSSPGRALLRQLLLQLLQRGEQQQRSHIEAQQREQEEVQRRREAKEKAIAEAKALADAQARAEAQAQADVLQRTREQEQSRRRVIVEEQTGSAEQRLRSTKQSATLLPIGSWVEIHDELGSAQRLKLAVKLPSSGKLIFVDRDGTRRAEFDRDALAARLLEGSARVLDEGPQFEDTLARVVGSLRRDRAAKE